MGHRAWSKRRGHGVREKSMAKFRFQDLEIWKDAISIADKLFDIADMLENKKLYRFADQLRGSAMSISNNIAEGSGSVFKKEFNSFLNIARRSVFENANILILLFNRNLIKQEEFDNLIDALVHLSSRITNFQKSLK